MKCRHHQLEYEINDEWLAEAGARGFVPTRDCYRTQSAGVSKEKVTTVAIDSVEPLVERARLRGIFCDDNDTGVFAKERVIRILRWLVADHEIEPVKVVRSQNPSYKFKLVEGCHRFHCANALGFKKVPAVMGFDKS